MSNQPVPNNPEPQKPTIKQNKWIGIVSGHELQISWEHPKQ